MSRFVINSRATRRHDQLIELYGKECCLPSVELADKLNARFGGVPSNVTKSFLRDLHAGKLGGSRLHADLHHRYYQQLADLAETGWGKPFSQPTSKKELELFEGMRRNLSQLAAAKHHAAAANLRKLRSLTLPAFLRESAAYMSVTNGQWLRTEARSAMVMAQSAENWAVFERRAFLYPNLKYDAVNDARTRPLHLGWDGAIYPVNHPIWDTLMPPNDWNCRCKVLQTDQPANFRPDAPEVAVGFQHNPGKTGVIFDDSHPYFDLAPQRRDLLNRRAEKLRFAREKGRNGALAFERFKDTNWTLPGMDLPARVTAEGLAMTGRSLARRSIIEPAVGSDLLTALDLVMPLLQLVGEEAYAIEVLGTTYLFAFSEGVLTSITTP